MNELQMHCWLMRSSDVYLKDMTNYLSLKTYEVICICKYAEV